MAEEDDKKEDKPEEGRSISVPNYTGAEMVVHAEATKWLKEPLEVDPEPKDAKDIVVVASNPRQMQNAQAQLVVHFTHKLQILTTELNEAEQNYHTARKNKWKAKPFEAVMNKVKISVDYYTKIKAALEAGYVIVPNFEDLDIFAIRTTRKKPKENVASGGSTWVQRPDEQITNRPPIGMGRYVNADTKNTNWTIDTTKPGATEKTYKMMSKAVAFDDIEFPFHLVKPQILESTSKAMDLLVFDDIGVRPGRNIRRGDPMIVGRIMHGVGFRAKSVSFLITWFVDTKDL